MSPWIIGSQALWILIILTIFLTVHHTEARKHRAKAAKHHSTQAVDPCIEALFEDRSSHTVELLTKVQKWIDSGPDFSSKEKRKTLASTDKERYLTARSNYYRDRNKTTTASKLNELKTAVTSAEANWWADVAAGASFDPDPENDGSGRSLVACVSGVIVALVIGSIGGCIWAYYFYYGEGDGGSDGSDPKRKRKKRKKDQEKRGYEKKDQEKRDQENRDQEENPKEDRPSTSSKKRKASKKKSKTHKSKKHSSHGSSLQAHSSSKGRSRVRVVQVPSNQIYHSQGV